MSVSIPEFFCGKNVFITGGTGFIGKVLIEKLLRSCPDIGNIYLLIRSKRGVDPQSRVNQIIDNPLFHLIKKNDPCSLNRIIAVPGNIEQLKLGLSEEDEKLLTSRVNVIYHCAADVNFDKSLKYAILTNVRGGRELSNLAMKCENLDVLVHVSTMYSNCDEDVIDEKIYAPNVSWRDLIELAEDDSFATNLEIMSLKFIHPFPNTYTFSKKITEQMFVDMCKDNIPLVICRPSVVSHILRDPLPGWCDNLNGPASMLLVSLKGIIDIFYGHPNTCLDKVSVDWVVKTMIIASWKKCMDSNNTKDVTIYNVCSDIIWKLKYYFDVQSECLKKVPFENRFGWGGTSRFTTCWLYYYYNLVLFNLIPALFGDLILKLSGRKTMLFKYQKKIYTANCYFFSYFANRTFTFKNKGYVALENAVMDCDKAAFAFREFLPKDVHKAIFDLAEEALMGIKKFVLHEKYPIAPETYSNTKKFYILHLVIVWLRYLIIGYFLFWKWNFHLLIFNKMHNYIACLK